MHIAVTLEDYIHDHRNCTVGLIGDLVKKFEMAVREKAKSFYADKADHFKGPFGDFLLSLLYSLSVTIPFNLLFFHMLISQVRSLKLHSTRSGV